MPHPELGADNIKMRKPDSKKDTTEEGSGGKGWILFPLPKTFQWPPVVLRIKVPHWAQKMGPDLVPAH